MSRPRDPIPSDYVLSPAQLASETAAFIRGVKGDRPRPTTGHASLDRHITPLYGGSMTVIVARPGNGKSMLLKAFAKREAKRITDAGEPSAVVYVTLEDSPASVALGLLKGARPIRDYIGGDFDEAAEVLRAASVAELPVWLVKQRPSAIGGEPVRRMALTIEMTLEAIRTITDDHGVRPSLVCIDYLQLMRTVERLGKEDDRQAVVALAAEASKELALVLDTPVVLAVQAARTVDQRKPPIPALTDMQWSSSIEQATDLALGLWKPSRSRDITGSEEPVDLNGRRYPVTDALLVLRVLKQRHGGGYGTFAAHLDPTVLELYDLAREYDYARP